jgi:dolichyl-phosphate-mannose-protein mannosyltransferase
MRFAVFIFALVVRIAAIEGTGAETIAFGDGPDYVGAARSVCVEHVYPERGNLPFFRAPGLPFFIAGATGCEPSRTRAIKYGLAVCDALTVLLIYLIARGNVIAALLAALHPFFVGAVTDIRGEPLFMMLLVLSIWLLLRGRPALSGIALGLATLTRPTGLLCIPLFAIFAASREKEAHAKTRRREERGWKSALFLLFAAALTLAPWTIRNYVRFHELIPVNDAAGFNLWRGTNPELLQIVVITDQAEFARRSLLFETQTVSAAAREVDARAKTPGARDGEWRRLAMENIRRDPGLAIRSTLKKIALYWRPWLHPAEHGWKAIVMSLVVTVGLYVFGAIGLWREPDRRLALAVAVFFAAMWLAHAPYIPSMRLRIPLTDPLLIVFAASALLDLGQHHRQRAQVAVVGAGDPGGHE